MKLAIIGIHPQISLAELTAIYGSVSLHNQESVIFTGEVYPHLGGTSQIGEIITTLPTTREQDICNFLTHDLPAHLNLPETKFTLGISLFGTKISRYRPLMFEIKKSLKAKGLKPRIVLPSGQTLNTAQIHHNQLDSSNYGIMVSRGADSTIIARTTWVQDIDNYTKRDITRPCRDMKVGMLPPKLAQIMLNLAPGDTVFDPFCGTGVVLQEALLMGRTATGSDLSEKMVNCTKSNLSWLESAFSTKASGQITPGDARNIVIPPDVNSVVTEGYLGPIVTSTPSSETASKLADESDILMRAMLKNLALQLKSRTRLCLAAPAWQCQKLMITPSLVDAKNVPGYNVIRLHNIDSLDLIYKRDKQYVGRALILLEKS